MKICTGNLWDYDGYHIVPTNWETKLGGEAIMGAGVARQAKRRYPKLAKLYGEIIRANEEPFVWTVLDYNVICFPTKYTWKKPADIGLIESGVHSLQYLDELEVWSLEAEPRKKKFYLPWLGTGLGGLKQEVVRPILEELSDNFIVVGEYK